MLRALRIIKGLFIGILAAIAVLYGASHIVFSIPSVQKKIADAAEKNISSLLGTGCDSLDRESVASGPHVRCALGSRTPLLPCKP